MTAKRARLAPKAFPYSDLIESTIAAVAQVLYSLIMTNTEAQDAMTNKAAVYFAAALGGQNSGVITNIENDEATVLCDDGKSETIHRGLLSSTPLETRGRQHGIRSYVRRNSADRFGR